jgi:hypothetical protein
VTRTRVALALLLTAALASASAAITLAWFSINRVERPVSYTVVKGDTLFEIAEDHGVTLADLRTWNTLDGDLIEVDQVLLVWPSNTPIQDRQAVTPKGRARPHSPAPETPANAANLKMPPAKTCLEGPALRAGGDDEQMVASAGLTPTQVRDAMNHFVSHTLTCIAGSDAPPEEALLLEITAGCDGRVSKIAVLDSGDWSSDMATCVTTVLGFTPFPAHDLPGGETFQYPLTYRAG